MSAGGFAETRCWTPAPDTGSGLLVGSLTTCISDSFQGDTKWPRGPHLENPQLQGVRQVLLSLQTGLFTYSFTEVIVSLSQVSGNELLWTYTTEVVTWGLTHVRRCQVTYVPQSEALAHPTSLRCKLHHGEESPVAPHCCEQGQV